MFALKKNLIPRLGKIFYGLMRGKLNFLEGMCFVTTSVNVTQRFRKRTLY